MSFKLVKLPLKTFFIKTFIEAVLDGLPISSFMDKGKESALRLAPEEGLIISSEPLFEPTGLFLIFRLKLVEASPQFSTLSQTTALRV